MTDATAVVQEALAGTGIELVASCTSAEYDAAAPADLQAGRLVPGARGVVVAASAGSHLWRRFADRMRANPGGWQHPHPYDAFVGEQLARADRALDEARIAFRRFEAAVDAPVRVSFVALGKLAALGAPGPFGLLIHPQHGPWWALRGAWVVAADVGPPRALVSPCADCAAPCVGGWDKAGGILAATVEARSLCVVGQASRYDDDQIGYHYERARTVARLRKQF